MVHFDENNEVQVQQSHPMETSLSSDRKLVDNYFEIDNGKDILRQSIEKHQWLNLDILSLDLRIGYDRMKIFFSREENAPSILL